MAEEVERQAGRAGPRVPTRFGIRGTGLLGEMSAEFFGTMVLILFGDGSVAMAVVALNQSGRAQTPHTIFLASGDWLLIVWGWAFAVMFGVYVCAGISGGHINPAVTLAFAVRGALAWRKVVPYWVAQWLGAFVGAAIVYAVYGWAIHSYLDVNHLTQSKDIATFSIFATFPAPFFHTYWGPLIDQVVGTALLLIGVAAIIDRRNVWVKGNLGPFLIGLLVAAIGASFGANAGYAINPARDFGPRVWAWIAGWGQTAFPGNYPNLGWYFWIPIVGPFVGGVIGILLYDFFITTVLKSRGVPEATE